jgi:GT2 family glycosyltransferase
MIDAPVLLITFNRPDTTAIVLDSIRKAKIKRLYIFNDAPRYGNKEDEIARIEIQNLIKNIDWECEVKTNFPDKNLGCGPGPSSAITWAFTNEDRLIILEDDCVPALPFFSYCNNLLEKYKNDTRIWLVSGNNYSEEQIVGEYDYFFSKYGHSWGWATWKRCWAHFDIEMKKFPQYEKDRRYLDAYTTKREALFFFDKQKRIYTDKTKMSHIWDFQAGFMIRSNSGLCIVPRKNLVRNIGYFGTHSEEKNKFHDCPVDEDYTVRIHPDFVLINKDYDLYHFMNHWRGSRRTFVSKIINKLRKYIKK